MGERNWYQRYHDAREYADEQAAAYQRGEIIENWRQVSEHDTRRETLTGAAWVSWAYEIAASNAKALVDTQGKQWQSLVDECERLRRTYEGFTTCPNCGHSWNAHSDFIARGERRCVTYEPA